MKIFFLVELKLYKIYLQLCITYTFKKFMCSNFSEKSKKTPPKIQTIKKFTYFSLSFVII
jgi:hypothetical protein